MLFGGAGSGSSQVIHDAETLEAKDIGVEGSIMGFVTKEHNGKAYFIANRASGNVLYSFDVAANKAEVVEGFTNISSIALRCRDPFVTLTLDGITYENCIMTCYGSGVIPRLFNLDTKTVATWSDFTSSLTEAKRIQNIAPGPEGSNEIYIGGYQSGRVGVYNTSTKKITPSLFSNGHDQSDSFYSYKGKLYGGAYSGAFVYQYDPESGNVTQLINGLKDDFMQRRIHEVTAGDDKVFFSTIPDTGLLGGCIDWYDLSTGRAYVIPQEGHLYYCDNPGDAKDKIWYNAAGEKTDVASMKFNGIVEDQVLISLEYQNGLLYGASSISGGSSSVSTQTEAKILVYDVANGQKLGDYSISDAVTDIADAEGKIPYISGIEADPDTAGKFWGVVDETLFSFTYDAASTTMSVKEELSFAKNHAYIQNGSWKTGSRHWFPRPILFDGQGYMYVGFGTSSTGIQKIKISDPTVHEQVIASATRDYVLGEDGNLYYMSDKNLMMVALSGHGDEAANAVKDQIDAIGEVTLKSAGAITAARTAYDALTDLQKPLVTNLQTLVDAEAKLAELTASAVTLTKEYRFGCQPPLAIPEGSSYIGLENTHIEALAEAYAAGTIEIAYIGKNAAKNPNMTATGITCNTVYGEWLAFKVKAPGTGEYEITLNHTTNSKNTDECSIYILPGDTAFAGIDAALASAEAIGAVNLGSKPLTNLVGSYQFEASKDYVIVFKATQDSSGKTTAGANAQMRLSSLDMTSEVMSADLEAAQAAQKQIDAIGTVTLSSEEAIKAARAAYDALTDEQKALVSNLSVLTAAETALAALKIPQTGDAAPMAAMLSLLVLSAAALSVLAIFDTRKKNI